MSTTQQYGRSLLRVTAAGWAYVDRCARWPARASTAAGRAQQAGSARRAREPDNQLSVSAPP